MCTLIVLHRCVPRRPLVVAANRDEFLERPAEDLAIRASGTGPIVAPLDLEAGGTWVGLSQRGVFAGLTNLRPANPPATGLGDPSRKSRGDVVMSALEAESAAAAAATFRALEESAYNPFQLLVADGQDAFLVVYRDRAKVLELEPGPHIVGNVEDESIAERLGPGWMNEIGAGQAAEADDALAEEPRAIKLTRIRERVEKMVMEPDFDLFEGLARICREHVGSEGIERPLEATCVHIPKDPAANGRRSDDAPVADRYGTRSSLLLSLAEDEGTSRLWATDGPPCVRPYENRSSLLKDLGVRLGA